MRVLILFFTLLSCTTAPPTVRSPYQLMRINDFLISNVYVSPEEVNSTTEGVRFSYDLLIKNLQDSPRNLNLEGSAVMIDKIKTPVECFKFKTELKMIELKGDETLKVSCTVKVKNPGAVGDVRAIIGIPLQKETALFTYLLRSEDFR